MSRPVSVLMGVPGLFLGLLTACAPAYRGEPIAGPLELGSPTLMLGRQLFDRNCDQCHPGGAAGLGPFTKRQATTGPTHRLPGAAWGGCHACLCLRAPE